jgi:hypothetical protein
MTKLMFSRRRSTNELDRARSQTRPIISPPGCRLASWPTQVRSRISDRAVRSHATWGVSSARM